MGLQQNNVANRRYTIVKPKIDKYKLLVNHRSSKNILPDLKIFFERTILSVDYLYDNFHVYIPHLRVQNVYLVFTNIPSRL